MLKKVFFGLVFLMGAFMLIYALMAADGSSNIIVLISNFSILH